MLTFAHEWAFFLLPLPLLVYWLAPPYLEGRPAARVPAFAGLETLSGGARGAAASARRRGLLLATLQIIAWVALVTALSRPQWLEAPIIRTEPTRDLLLAVDLSGSMEAEDFTTRDGRRIDRLTAVKEVLGDFLTEREGDRVGVIVFGNRAYVQVPLTQDLEVARRMLEETVPRMAGPKTALGDAIGLAISLFERSEVKNRVLIALTDGNDTGSRIPPAEAARIARDRGITIYAVAVGDPSSTGEEALDEEALRAVARVTGGRYFFAADRDTLQNIYDELDRLETREVETVSYRPVRDLYPWPLGVFLAAMLGYHSVRALRATLLGRRRAAFEFLRPIWLLALVPLFGVWLAQRQARGLPPSLRQFAARHLLEHLLVPARTQPWVRPDQLMLPIGVLTVLALAGPSFRMEPSPFAEDRAAVVAILRVDASMEAGDLAPSRLDRARYKLRDLASVRKGAPLGLIAYGGSAHVVTPITRDAEVVAQMAAALDPSVMPRDGDALPDALALAHALLTEAKLPGSILVLTDGVAPEAVLRLEADPPGGRRNVQFLATVSTPELAKSRGISAAARILSAPVELVTIDDADVRALGSRAEVIASSRDAANAARRRDEGWLLLPAIALGALVWGRRGWSVQWD